MGNGWRRDCNRNNLGLGAALLMGRGIFLSVAELGQFRVDLLALIEEQVDGLLFQLLDVLERCHNLLWCGAGNRLFTR